MQAEEAITGIQDILPFLKLYPFPAWVSGPSRNPRIRKSGLELEPAWSNPAFDALFGSHDTLITILGTSAQQLINYGTWLEESQPHPSILRVSLASPADNLDTLKDIQVDLELVKTIVHDADGQQYVVCTSTSKEELPEIRASIQAHENSPKRRKGRSMKLRDLPAFRPGGNMHAIPNCSGGSGSEATIRALDGNAGRGPKMAELVERFPWETTSLGTRDEWDMCLRQAVDLTLNSPYPTAIWWGPDLVMLYNDAYADMSTTKHPRILGQNGVDAWAELWETLGPAVAQCMKGDPIYKHDGT